MTSVHSVTWNHRDGGRCLQLLQRLWEPETLEDRELTDIEGDDRTIVNLLTDQVEFANVIILNKIDMVSEEHLGILRGTLQKLNPGAQIVETNFSEVNPTRILNTGLFDFEDADGMD